MHYTYSGSFIYQYRHYCSYSEVVDLCSRLVEVNGVSVLESSEEELEILLKTPVAHIIVLRQLPRETRQEEPSDPRQTLALSDDQDLHHVMLPN